MKKMIALFSVLFMVLTLNAAPPAGWMTDIDKAMEKAKKEKKDLFVLFTGSDWCGYCIKLRTDVLDQAGFKKFAGDKLILLYCDFPAREQLPREQLVKQATLSKKLGASDGVPSAVILAPDGKIKGKIGGYAGFDAYMKRLKDIIK